jgi:hypothetical protein
VSVLVPTVLLIGICFVVSGGTPARYAGGLTYWFVLSRNNPSDNNVREPL